MFYCQYEINPYHVLHMCRDLQIELELVPRTYRVLTPTLHSAVNLRDVLRLKSDLSMGHAIRSDSRAFDVFLKSEFLFCNYLIGL